MEFGNHINATWGMGGEKDSLNPWYVEKECPPLPPGFNVLWRPSRQGVSWGVGFLKYDIKGWTDATQSDTFRLYFANAVYPDADITITWPDSFTLHAHATAMSIKIDTIIIDMFTQTSFNIVDAGDVGINQAYIYKTGAFLVDCVGGECSDGVEERIKKFPGEYRLSQNYPNPQNPTSTITYDLPKASYVTLNIYNTLGQQVTTLIDEQKQPGRYDILFDGSKLTSGVYFYRIVAGEFTQTKKMILIR
jgi:hypothetical protein